ncbi:MULTISPECIES: hypothetical protein [Rhizobium]|uniref:DUF904 domain-containing protein n=1 Tax=Rhizobium indicum TaxID=2583231 RepID=A0ABX6PEV8_9HYPH|nr:MULTISPECIES: hypothetical protein [Rhizobium]MBY5869308.1 hypothetical protein [Rhizobium leguminosarum]NKM08374.1 hypothetical protein [Rhizobium leguminosarum bv. viciae]QKK16828.1 hypothetical protein FFM53_010595 [Rhizobium indicum]TAU03562.1 hypothetical protein ELI55_00870 [Rhizobium ruizarguesonis]TAU46692.1 hypothetical protein ELI42_00860 [Rhizobium ruizarguesonis]
MAVELSEQQQLALFDVLREANIALQTAKDQLVSQPNGREQAIEKKLLQKIANLENAEKILRPLAKKING